MVVFLFLFKLLFLLIMKTYQISWSWSFKQVVSYPIIGTGVQTQVLWKNSTGINLFFFLDGASVLFFFISGFLFIKFLEYSQIIIPNDLYRNTVCKRDILFFFFCIKHAACPVIL